MISVSVGTGVVPRVTIDSATVGLPVVGVTAGGARWEAVRSFPGHRVVDQLAPLNQAFWYEQSDGGVSVSVVRETRARTVFTSLDGRVVVPFVMPHEWADVTDPDVAVFQTAGRVWHVAGRAPKVGARTIQARVEGADIEAMRALVRTGEAAFLHAPCPVPHCPVPDALTGAITGSPGDLAERFDVGEMIYRVEFMERSFPRPVAALSWSDVANYADWAAVAAAHSSWADVRDGV